MNNLKFKAENFLTKLPKAYYSNELDMSLAGNIWNFEVNGLPRNGEFKLELKFVEGVNCADICLDRMNFTPLKIKNGIAELSVSITHLLLSFDIALPEKSQKAPVVEASLNDYSTPCLSAVDFELYVRDTKIGACNLLDDWKTSYEKIMSDDFSLNEIADMRDEIINWSAKRQVLDETDPHYGAIYSEEDKYCFNDALFGACGFMRKFIKSNDPQWLDKAIIAKDYAFKGQFLNTGNVLKDGGWTRMSCIDDPRGKQFRRISDQWGIASGVYTSMVGIYSNLLHLMGMKFTEPQLDQLRGAVNWQLRNRISPGWFSHHEGMNMTCVNVNSLAVSMIFAVHQTLMEQTGRGLGSEALDEAVSGYNHVLKTQEAIGVYPYRLGDYKRSGKYWLHNTPDNGIGLQAQMHLIKNKYSPFAFEDLKLSMRRTALWYLLTSRLRDDRLVLDFDHSHEYLKGLAFGNFTWCRITMLDIVSQLWDSIGDTGFWKQFVRCHLRTIRETLWNHTDKERAPLVPSTTPLKLVHFIQQAEWAALVFDNLSERYGIEASPGGQL